MAGGSSPHQLAGSRPHTAPGSPTRAWAGFGSPGAPGVLASRTLMRHKQRAPSAKSKPTTSFAWTPTPFQTVVELPSRPGTARPGSAVRPPKSIKMTLHYSRARMDTATAVTGVGLSSPQRPATAEQSRFAAGSGNSAALLASRPSTSRDERQRELTPMVASSHPTTPKLSLATPRNSSLLHGVATAVSAASTMYHHRERENSWKTGDVSDTRADHALEWTRGPAGYDAALEDAAAEVDQMVVQERTPAQQRVGKREEFEHIESLLRNPRKIHEQRRKEQIEEDVDPRKEALQAYQDMCVTLRISCRKHLTVEHYENELANALRERARQENRSTEEARADTSSKEYASPAKIQAMSDALYKTLRQNKPRKPSPQRSWRDKYDADGNDKDAPWWTKTDPFEDVTWLRKYEMAPHR